MTNSKIAGFKEFEELGFSDDFMFGKVMQDSGLCHDVLECLLQRPIGELREVSTQEEFRYTNDGKSIRVDIYTRDDKELFDAEMQNKGKRSIASLELPKRSRFYQSSIDMDFLDKGNRYGELPECTILFICTFDPFGKGLPKYTFRGSCEEDVSIVIGDGATRVFFNCSYEGSDIPEELEKLYRYIENGKSGSRLTERLDNAVKEARKKREWRSAYMKERILLMDAKYEGIEEGRAEGREEGIEIGSETSTLKGIRSIMQTMRLSAEEAMNALLIPADDREKYLSKL